MSRVVTTDEEALAALEEIRRENSRSVTRGLLDQVTITALTRAGWAARHKRGYAPEPQSSSSDPDLPQSPCQSEDSFDEQGVAQAIAEPAAVLEEKTVDESPAQKAVEGEGPPPHKKRCRLLFSKNWFLFSRKRKAEEDVDGPSSASEDTSGVSSKMAQYDGLKVSYSSDREVAVRAHQSHSGRIVSRT